MIQDNKIQEGFGSPVFFAAIWQIFIRHAQNTQNTLPIFYISVRRDALVSP